MKELNAFTYRNATFTPLYEVPDIWQAARRHAGRPYKGFRRDGGYSWDGFYKAAKAANGGRCDIDLFQAKDGTIVCPATCGLLVWED